MMNVKKRILTLWKPAMTESKKNTTCHLCPLWPSTATSSVQSTAEISWMKIISWNGCWIWLKQLQMWLNQLTVEHFKCLSMTLIIWLFSSVSLKIYVFCHTVEITLCFTDSDRCETCPAILERLETIDDDTDKHNIQFVKTNDVKLAHEIGVFSFPALIYYETGVPIMFDGECLLYRHNFSLSLKKIYLWRHKTN